jgi:hypothetical protein
VRKEEKGNNKRGKIIINKMMKREWEWEKD